MMSIFIIFFYLTIRIGLNPLWETISPLYSYLFEVCFVVSCFLVYRKKKKHKIFNVELDKNFLLQLLPWPFVGFIVYRLALKSTILIPFEFNSVQILLLLLIVAPVLEEFIFRYALWEAVSDLVKSDELKVWISSLLFSIGHLISMFMISPDFRPFVLYQSFYVIILGFGVSQMRIKTGSITGSILIHFLFNLGFYLGSLV